MLSIFTKAALVSDILALLNAVGPLLAPGSDLLAEAETVALEAAGLVRHLDTAAAQQFAADVRKLWADAMQAYSGNGDAVAAFLAAVKKLIADVKG